MNCFVGNCAQPVGNWTQLNLAPNPGKPCFVASRIQLNHTRWPTKPYWNLSCGKQNPADSRVLSLPPPLCLSVCQSVSVSHPHPPPPPSPSLSPSLRPPLSLLHPSFPLCSVSPLGVFWGFLFCFVFITFVVVLFCFFFVVVLFCFLSWVFFFFFVGFLILHVRVLSVCNILLIFGFVTPRTGFKCM